MTSPSFIGSLRSLYLTRFAFAIVWAALLVPASISTGPFLIALLVIYPLFDAAAVLWQIRAQRDTSTPRVSAWANVVVSGLVAVALGIAASISMSGALAVWGVWAIGSGVPQLITAVRNRRAGGQVAQMLSGGISVFAGAAFLFQGLRGEGAITGVAGYAVLGGIFFLISWIRLGSALKSTE